MDANTSKTRFIELRNQGKRIDPQDCIATYKSSEIGHPNGPNLISPIDSGSFHISIN